MKNTIKKNTIKVFGIIAFVAVIGFSFTACRVLLNATLDAIQHEIRDDDSSGGSLSGGSQVTAVPSQLDAVWGSYSNQRSRFVNRARFTISGTRAVLTDISDVEATSNIFRDALVKGFVKVGDTIIRNIRMTGAVTYSCEVLFMDATGNTANSAQWRAATITMTNNAQRFSIDVEGFGNIGVFSKR